MDDRVEDLEVRVRAVGREDDDELALRGHPGQRRQVVGAVDRGSVVRVVGARQDHGPDRCQREALQLGRDALHGSPRLRVRVEQVAGDEEEVDLLVEGELDGGLERRELALALRRRRLAEVGMTGPQMHVGRVEQSKHAERASHLGSEARHPPGPVTVSVG